MLNENVYLSTFVEVVLTKHGYFWRINSGYFSNSLTRECVPCSYCYPDHPGLTLPVKQCAVRGQPALYRCLPVINPPPPGNERRTTTSPIAVGDRVSAVGGREHRHHRQHRRRIRRRRRRRQHRGRRVHRGRNRKITTTSLSPSWSTEPSETVADIQTQG